ncbi:HAMP domain-containing sensor histidine kinase [Marivirga salinae]|uniref:histidine kinase n=1 Tax=Marivirga salinarum TaxID=3059078 RepID=A0AA49GBK1_9BACT|nr:HAMP domain-containing sensor histidine kinase [Marivirga sp. BDSF4-3]WKK74062.2 HAMP domain-containing sensor histidine kinase [Marivirga sp. BDSF4-3]
MIRFFNLNKWSKLEKSLEQKPNILLSQFSIIAVIAALIQVINDLFNTNYIAVGFDLIIVGIAVATYIVNEKRNHVIAKFIFIVLGTGYIFVYSSIIPKSIGVYLIFFPILAIIFLVFSNEEIKYKYYSVVYVLILLFILEITEYQPFGEINLTGGKSESTSFYVNMLISIFVLVFSMYNMDVINKHIDQVRLETLKELEQKNKELELANDELDHFVYSASHDLKAPLSSILGLINIAKYEVKDDNVMDYFIRIENRIERLTQFIKEVIEISRNTRTEIKTEPIELEKLLDEIIENNNYIEGMEKIEFNKQIQFDSPLFTDKARMEVILNNLISNAIKYSDPSKGHCKIDITADKTSNKFRIIIADNGIGIPKDQQEKVFEMFYRGAQSKEGSGLGLYIVKNMLVKLKGEFDLNSKVGVGTKIELTFPIL